MKRMDTAKAIDTFNNIRDIPFGISSPTSNTCDSKCQMLARELTAQGYDCQLMIGGFKWSDIGLPKDVITLCKNVNERHVFVRVRQNNNEMFIDPTIDMALTKYLPTASWDGQHSTNIFASPTNIRKYYPYSNKEKLRSKYKKLARKITKRNNQNFYDAVDNWLKTIRSI